MFIHEFWIEMFPIFEEFQVIYLFLDLATLVVLINIVIGVPSMILLSRKDRL